MMKKLYLGNMLASLLLLSGSVVASETYFHYQHSYGTQNKYHGDEFGILHQTDEKAWVDITIHLYNKGKNVALDDVVSNSYSMTVGYDYALNNTLTLTPNMEARFYSGGKSGEATTGDVGDTQKAGARYTPGLKLSWQVISPLTLYTQYRYDYRKINRSAAGEGEQNRHRHRLEGGIAFAALDTLILTYQANYYNADYILANNKKSDYQQDVKADWIFLPDWQLNLAAEDVAKSKTSNSREALLKAGFTYRF
ncbi:oligogalacturonate-specific porin KdgM family protein [Klebsiella sp. BIGb0407]|uniref:oligogalacturonate-specific porin KdgM family protein n=1 Tax=Klebsiella sp. BIGb0407 TaxID=2940603 RepID=UPI0021675F6B|nr:oligogalacturonate-specific porin KdgM family protein [Klebsiella sp. BIGb0407]MCS3432221.1 hypothetical protein [Klebsiella sp. BIGb0407]